MSDENQSLITKLYLALRWPVVFGLLALSGSYFLVGLVTSLGYRGTTNLRPMDEKDTLWTEFQNDFEEKAGAPFDLNEGEIPIKDGKVLFDKRLVKIFNYLKVNNNEKCGWSNRHERISIDLRSATYSDQTPAKDYPLSLSTVYRGVGARIFAADYIKCTEEPINTSCHTPDPIKFQNGAEPVGTYPIRLSNHADDEVSPDSHDPNCKVTCAYDYFPNNPIDATADEKTEPKINPAVVKATNYSNTPFPIEQITDKAKEGAFYKIILLTFEILKVDEPGCDNGSGNTGSLKKIPITIHLPEWAKVKLDKEWEPLVDIARENIPFGFQDRSPLAGLHFDRALNDKGLHINY